MGVSKRVSLKMRAFFISSVGLLCCLLVSCTRHSASGKHSRSSVDTAAASGEFACALRPDGTLHLIEDCHDRIEPSIHPQWSPNYDAGPAVKAAMETINNNHFGTLIFPTGPGLVNQTIEVKSDYVGIMCAGAAHSCQVIMDVPDIPHVLVNKYAPSPVVFGAPSEGIYNLNISGIFFNRWGGATEGGDGIVLSGYVDRSIIEEVTVIGSYNNIVFGPTTTSYARSIIALNAINDNIQFRPRHGESGSVMQWALDHIDAAGAGRFGIYVSDIGATHPGGLGEWRDLQTYDNGQGSLQIVAYANSISGVRITSSWFCCSRNTDREVYLELRGGINNRFSGVSIEGIANSNNGFGLMLGPTVEEIVIVGGKVVGLKRSGIYSAAKKLNLSGTTLKWNGGDLTQGHRHGIEIVDGTAVISGLQSIDNSGYGIAIASDTVFFSAGDLSGNVGGPLLNVVPLINSQLCTINGIADINCN